MPLSRNAYIAAPRAPGQPPAISRRCERRQGDALFVARHHRRFAAHVPNTRIGARSESQNQPVGQHAGICLEPASSAVPTAATEYKQNDDNDQKCRRVHGYLLRGYFFAASRPTLIDASEGHAIDCLARMQATQVRRHSKSFGRGGPN